MFDYTGQDFETGMDLHLYVLENYDLIYRSIERAEIFINSYEFNICEWCLSNEDLEDCYFCIKDFSVPDIYGFHPIAYTLGGYVWKIPTKLDQVN